MALNEIEQIKKLLTDKRHFLIVFGNPNDGDALSSSVALYQYLANLGKKADIVCNNFLLPSQFSFLKGSKGIHPTISHLKKFILTLNVKETGVQELSYDLVSNKLRIFITPKEGTLERSDVQTAETDFKYDLIVTIGSPDLESLGSIFEKNTGLFHKAPIINIDNNVANEHFGHINAVDITATSSAEVLYEILRQVNAENIDSSVATAILTGMISATQSFKADNVKPNTLSIAGKLIRLGADRDFIVKNLYRTRSISALKLWGEALTHLEIKQNSNLVWTTITREAFTRSGAKESDLKDLVSELISSSPEAEVIVILHEHPQESAVHTIVYSKKGTNSRHLLKQYNPTGNAKEASTIFRDKTLKQVEELIIPHIENQL